MMKSFIERENEIFSILGRFNKAKLSYVLIRGYAVSAYMRRFSVDADVCIEKKDLKAFREVLKEKRYGLIKRMDLGNSYDGEFKCYTKKENLSVTVDLLINSVASRQTGGSISFSRIFENSKVMGIKGIEKEVKARIPAKEALIAMKIHSARMLMQGT